MILEVCLGVVLGALLQPLYYDYLFVAHPAMRAAIIGMIPPLVIAAALMFVTESVFSIGSRARRPIPFWQRAFGVSLFLSAFLQVEAAKLAEESTVAAYLAPGLAALLTMIVTVNWVRYHACKRAAIKKEASGADAVLKARIDKRRQVPQRLAANAIRSEAAQTQRERPAHAPTRAAFAR
ncbi:MAG: hypothetical protein O3A46_12525 [Candidatus Poribacteria bacterium]|nr:hypothetical protein [Candidatus Poribacteria bacterium]